ncbi:MFS transporter [Sphingomonas naphthae]|uniref:MFS transporter n=1 Tax=Sphingomonas naphthae TaxID=1813468 RepID=A0ABY7TMF5_9SPHN|nr:MFS transporter [Sphingomonas naphthae]WCT74344.1 MFS transporter [Sphingomonas naphthae]
MTGPAGAFHLKLRHYLSYGVGQIGNQVMRDVPGAMLLFYMTNALSIPPSYAGLAILIPKLWIIIADPMVGMLSDRTHTRIGARKPYLIGGSLISGLTFMLLFSVPVPDSEALRALLIGTLYWLLSTAFSFYSVPYLTLASELGDEPYQRTKALAFRQYFGLAGVLAGLSVAPWLIALMGGTRSGYALMGVALGTLILVTTMLTAIFVPVRQPARTAPPPGNILVQMRSAFRHRPFRIIFLASAAQLFGFGFHSSGMVYFIVYFLKLPLTTVSGFILASVAGAAIGQPLWVMLAKRHRTIVAYRWATGWYGLAHLLCLFLSPGDQWIFYAIGLFGGVGTCGLTLLSFAMLVETIGLDGPDSPRKGLFTSAYTAMEKAMLACGSFGVAAVLSLAGFVRGGGDVIQPASVSSGVAWAYVGGPAAMMIVAIFILSTYDPRRAPAPA